MPTVAMPGAAYGKVSPHGLVRGVIRQCMHGGPTHAQVASEHWYEMTHRLAMASESSFPSLAGPADALQDALFRDLLGLRDKIDQCHHALRDRRSAKVLASMAVEEWADADLTTCRRYAVLAATLRALDSLGVDTFFAYLRIPFGAPAHVARHHAACHHTGWPFPMHAPPTARER